MKRTKIQNSDRELSVEKKKAILEGAMKEFLAQGYAAASMDRIATAAGVSKATVYSHFQDKENLFSALVEQLVQKKFQNIFGCMDSQAFQGEPTIVLRQLATNMLNMAHCDEQFLNFMRLVIGESGRFPVLAQAFISNVEKSAFAKLCHYLASRHELVLSDVEVTARIFIGTLVHFIIIQYMLHGGDILPMERDRLIDNLIKLICDRSKDRESW
ncbi:TetR/AcrR family transcriptional regulator [Candidatus Gracilibacteria bacterium]|jgi:TetR/AcrR family transcriptional regulator, regulator of autoinduction and epiphytic fitness|nr:TetR/AcrR family transcriptional regulator [Candidatus Gracilibacteria bacterium]NJM87709.1 TetR/AcrR family transcriptional regulator [Hydrococcus sp. RU_2_2]NJP19416.1 TetR/AcrR family transcriptional regulator [Hydrococcus sp. CRU_1_1]